MQEVNFRIHGDRFLSKELKPIFKPLNRIRSVKRGEDHFINHFSIELKTERLDQNLGVDILIRSRVRHLVRDVHDRTVCSRVVTDKGVILSELRVSIVGVGRETGKGTTSVVEETVVTITASLTHGEVL